MRTPKLRAVAVIAGFAGISVLVAGTASAMVASHLDAPIASAVQLHQEDPTSQTPPVPAAVEPGTPVEVGSGAIKCDADGNCASQIKIEANDPAPEPVTADRTPTKPGPTAHKKDGPGPKQSDPNVNPRKGETAVKPDSPRDRGKKADGHRHDRRNLDEWAPDNWDNGRDDTWHQRWQDDLGDGWGSHRDRSQWNTGDWRDGWRQHNH